MSRSKLIDYVKISPNSNNPRNHKIDKITIHHMAGNLSVESCGADFAKTSRQASSNYGIGTDGRIGLYVEEENRAWTSSSPENDHRAVTIEVANDGGAPDWHVSDKALASLINLCVDICKRNGIACLNFTGDATGNLTMHKWFAATLCPGPYLESKFQYIAEEVNKRLAQKETKKQYSVRLGPYDSREKAEQVLSVLKAIAAIGSIDETAVEIAVTPEKEPAKEEPKKITVGSSVKVKKGAKTYEGKTLASFVYDRVHKVHQLEGDRAVITYSGTVVAAVRLADLYLE
ncbi:MAG: N-acetylmuramoyl-L-alanine amidase [Alistipes sp.]|nr:N-acetylmuramoyl-L-alanine amidase [Alistipes sp.]